MIWPAQYLIEQGHDVSIKSPKERDIKLRMDGERVAEVLDVEADVVVFQRLTHAWMAQSVALLRQKGIAVVVDVDDDLSSIHPRNPAYAAMHPQNEYKVEPGTREPRRHSWKNLTLACREATLVTVSTPALLGTYAKHGRGHVLYNYLPDIYYGVPHEDSEIIGWPAALASHPDDPTPVGGAIARLCGGLSGFQVVGDPIGCGEAFGLPRDPPGRTGIDVNAWPGAVAELGIGIAPLADTKFNSQKSWLKPMEMSALGVPWVASPRAEYTRLHAMGAGVLAERPRVWYRELKALRESASLRRDRAEAGRVVADQLRMRANAWRWLESWQRARDLQDALPTGKTISVG